MADVQVSLTTSATVAEVDGNGLTSTIVTPTPASITITPPLPATNVTLALS